MSRSRTVAAVVAAIAVVVLSFGAALANADLGPDNTQPKHIGNVVSTPNW